MSFIFLDESGQFAKEDAGSYFVVGSFTVGDPKRTEKQFRVWQHTRFPRKLKNRAEVKFSNRWIDHALRSKTLRFIANMDVHIHYVYLLRENIPAKYWKKDRLQSGLLYVDIVREVLEMYLPIREKEFRVFCDERHLKGLKRKEFQSLIEGGLRAWFPPSTSIQIEMLDPTTNANIQIADWITWALARYLEGKPSGTAYYEILRNNLLLPTGKECFGAQTNATKNPIA